MTFFITKVMLSALLVAGISELARRSEWLGALLASLPVVSLLAFIWIYLETGDTARIAALSGGIFWLVLPSLLLFVLLPLLLRAGFGFWPGLALACGATAGAYLLMLRMLKVFGVEI